MPMGIHEYEEKKGDTPDISIRNSFPRTGESQDPDALRWALCPALSAIEYRRSWEDHAKLYVFPLYHAVLATAAVRR